MTSNRLLNCRVPIAAAPMAGGPTTLTLAGAVASAGAFPFLAGGYKSVEALSQEIQGARGLGVEFGVNLFVPDGAIVQEAEFREYAAELQPEAAPYGLTLDPTPISDDDQWPAKLDLLTSDPVPVVSLTFGLPAPEDVEALQRSGSRVLISVTTLDEAAAARDAGADGLVVQGPHAGGHSAAHDPFRAAELIETSDLVREVREAVDLPIVGAGGVDGPEAVQQILEAGAEAAAVGTLLLCTDEAGTSATHRAALAARPPKETVVTRAFTGRPARALRNGFVERHHRAAPTAYPAIHHLTKAMRQAAGRSGDADRLHLWAGTGYQSAPGGPAAAAVEWLAGSSFPRPIR